MRKVLALAAALVLAAATYASTVVMIQKPVGGGGPTQIEFDASSEDDDVDGSTSEASFSWNHTPAGAPQGVGVCVTTKENADLITDVTYDGESLTQISEAVDTSGEPTRTTLFYLGTGVNTTSPAAIVVTRTNSATIMYATAFTVTGPGDSEVYAAGIAKLEGNGLHSEQSVTDASPGVNSLRFACLFTGDPAGFSDSSSGCTANVTPLACCTGSGTGTCGASSTQLQGIFFNLADEANAGLAREDAGGQGSRSVGLVSFVSDDRASLHFAVRDIP
jgi:hypothetical protein